MRKLGYALLITLSLTACGGSGALLARAPIAAPAITPGAGQVTTLKHEGDARLLEAAIRKKFPGGKTFSIISWKRTGFMGVGDWLRFEVDLDGRRITGEINTRTRVLKVT